MGIRDQLHYVNFSRDFTHFYDTLEIFTYFPVKYLSMVLKGSGEGGLSGLRLRPAAYALVNYFSNFFDFDFPPQMGSRGEKMPPNSEKSSEGK